MCDIIMCNGYSCILLCVYVNQGDGIPLQSVLQAATTVKISQLHSQQSSHYISDIHGQVGQGQAKFH